MRQISVRTAKYLLTQEKLYVEHLAHALECLAWIYRLIYHLEDTRATDRDLDLKEIVAYVKLNLSGLMDALSQLAFDRENSITSVLDSIPDDAKHNVSKAAP